MHEIPQLAERLLRAQGVTDAELDELRRTGTLRRGDEAGNSIDIQVADDDPATAAAQVNAISIDGIVLNGATIPPAALDKLKRYHRFMPDHIVQNIELAIGQDIDGDGQVGGGGSNPAPRRTGATGAGAITTGSVPAHPHVSETTHGYQVSGAMPTGTGTTDGPFVQKRVGGKLLPIILVLLAVGAVAYFLLR